MRRRRLTVAGMLCAACLSGMFALDASAQDATGSSTVQETNDTANKGDLLHDAKDGDLDMSRWLLDHKGFLPVPIIISDPAVGYGGGLAAVFFHRPAGAAISRKTADGREQQIAPNIFGAMALKTENGSYAYGGGAMLHFKDDLWRYTGGIAKSSFNLDFYTPGELIEPVAIGYNADGVVSFQKMARRLGDQDLFLGLSWTYMDLDLGFDVDSDRELFSDEELSERTSGLGLSLQYDQRDNSFTPNSGWLGMIEGNFYDGAIGSDVDFQSYRSHVYAYLPLADDRFVLGGRVDARWANGDIPFYRLPFIDLRGIGSARYVDTRAATMETELRWNMTPRWALIGFLGAGRTWGERNDFGEAQSQVAKGAGVRYLIARMLRLYVGADYAWGPEDETLYIQVGSAWR
ncbi:BamA/TamA family outer membrane protein [Lysobacter panacisoli]|uniref:BamA/TamA family outer membrane protein n=1 Tax=Lysobacter panacisoli TaxID=1255263 RepID=A0ABP9LNQ1_9GAMM|nr:BamA/TamA family outer membrane protein [Lysobacter panacisoli]